MRFTTLLPHLAISQAHMVDEWVEVAQQVEMKQTLQNWLGLA